MTGQKILSREQIEAFRTNKFAIEQVNDFINLIQNKQLLENSLVVDVGGGIGAFARQLVKEHAYRVRVIDADLESINICKSASDPSIEAIHGDALNPPIKGDEDIICFNLILHHIVGSSEEETKKLQMEALKLWLGNGRMIFVNEYVYESYWNGISGRLIYEVTRNQFFSRIASIIAAYIPSLRANTFGTGVRFRSQSEWIDIFKECGYRLVGLIQNQDEYISKPRRFLLLKTKRRDSFLLAS